MAWLQINGVDVEVVRKRIKNLNLSVRGPAGSVRVSAPLQTPDTEIRQLIVARMAWIARHRERLQARPAVTELVYANGDHIPLWGQALALVVQDGTRTRAALGEPGTLRLSVKAGDGRTRREQAVQAWHRAQLADRIPGLVAAWQPRLGVQVAEWRIRNMRTRWGSCNIQARRIWLSLALARYPQACLEYVVVHEMVHLLERYHNAHFYALMDAALPDWRERRQRLHGVA